MRKMTARILTTLILTPSTLIFAQTTFTPITSGVPVNESLISMGCSWIDYDNDGDLNLFVTNKMEINLGNAIQETGEINSFYENKGDGTFRLVTSGDIVTDVGTSNGSSWGDYDNDGWPDLFVANGSRFDDGGESNYLYRNNGESTFFRITTGEIVDGTTNSFSGAFGDYDNDGDLDLFVANVWGRNYLY